MGALDPQAGDVVRFWRDAGPKAWFTKDAAFDAEFRGKFIDLHFAASRRELDHWMNDAESALALMILLDQFPRNCFRGSGHMFATDPLARHFARLAVAAGYSAQVDPDLRVFLILPFEHSENLDDQQLSIELSRPLGEDYLKYAVEHHDIIKRFGHFPHRNQMVGRVTSPDERAYLDAGGFSG